MPPRSDTCRGLKRIIYYRINLSNPAYSKKNKTQCTSGLTLDRNIVGSTPTVVGLARTPTRAMELQILQTNVLKQIQGFYFFISFFYGHHSLKQILGQTPKDACQNKRHILHYNENVGNDIKKKEHNMQRVFLQSQA